MEKYSVKTVEKKIKKIVTTVPGSKSLTNRALLLAALNDGPIKLKGISLCDDAMAMLDCLEKLGFKIELDKEQCSVVVFGNGGVIPNKKATINVRSAGTTARFMTALLAFAGGEYTLESSEQMKKRPMKELLDVLEDLGVSITYMENEGHFPFVLKSEGLDNVNVSVDTTRSTQFASALILLSMVRNININLTGSRTDGAYIKMTRELMKQFASNRSSSFQVEPDVSAACYFYAMALILKTKVLVRNVYDDSLQGDLRFLEIIKHAGGRVKQKRGGILVDCTGVDGYDGFTVDMHDFSDQALTAAVLAAFARTDSTIKNIAHIRKQESDRVMVIKTELEKVGCNVLIDEHDGMTDVVIKPRKLSGAEIDTYEDHRVAMSFALLGLKVEDIVINDPMCCKKTFEDYFERIDEVTKG